MILPPHRDPCLVTIRRGGTLTDADHRLLALWAAACAEHVLPLVEAARPDDPRPRHAVDHARGWVRGEVAMMASRASGGHAMAAGLTMAPGGLDAGRAECRWQRDHLPEAVRELVLDDQRRRNAICWSVFSP